MEWHRKKKKKTLLYPNLTQSVQDRTFTRSFWAGQKERVSFIQYLICPWQCRVFCLLSCLWAWDCSFPLSLWWLPHFTCGFICKNHSLCSPLWTSVLWIEEAKVEWTGETFLHLALPCSVELQSHGSWILWLYLCHALWVVSEKTVNITIRIDFSF